jgi:hypothetical protein
MVYSIEKYLSNKTTLLKLKIMKKLIFTLIIINFTYGQTPIVPLNSNHLLHNSNGDYHKDTQNWLADFEGTWMGNFDGKSITIVLQKFTNHLFTYPNGSFCYKDVISGKFQITNSNGIVLVPFTPLNDFVSTKLLSTDCNDSRLILAYIDLFRCDVNGSVILKKSQTNSNQLNYFYDPEGFISISGCPFNATDIQQLPINTLVLTKQ